MWYLYLPVSGRALPILVAKNPRMLVATRESPSRPKVAPGGPFCPRVVSTVASKRSWCTCTNHFYFFIYDVARTHGTYGRRPDDRSSDPERQSTRRRRFWRRVSSQASALFTPLHWCALSTSLSASQSPIPWILNLCFV